MHILTVQVMHEANILKKQILKTQIRKNTILGRWYFLGLLLRQQRYNTSGSIDINGTSCPAPDSKCLFGYTRCQKITTLCNISHL